jgi:ubiquinone/menaquinone biosynthesis C-methylase UbiE
VSWEIGVGSGLNFRLYRDDVQEVIALEPDSTLIQMARSKSSGSDRVVTYIEASAEQIPLDNETVDTVVSTWTMCTIPDVHRGLEEIAESTQNDAADRNSIRIGKF